MREQILEVKEHPVSTGQTAGRIAWILSVLAAVIAAAGLILLILNQSTPIPARWGFRGFQTLNAIPAFIIGLLVARARPRNPIGWLLLGAGISAGLTGFVEEYAVYTILTNPGWFGGAVLVAGLSHWLWIPSYGLLAIFVPLLFPNGRLLSPRWRVVAWLGIVWVILSGPWMIFYPGTLENMPFINNPFGVDALKITVPWFSPSIAVLVPGLTLMAVAAVSLGLRFRGSSGEVRQQLKWFAYAAALMPLAGIVGQFEGFLYDVILVGMVALVPISIGIAILRYRLYDIDLLINRTLVYGALTALIVGLYALVVGSAGLVLQTSSNLAALFLTAILTVALFRPVRGVLQHGVDRIMTIPAPKQSEEIPADSVDEALPQVSVTWLRVARMSWVVLGVMSLGVLIASLPAYGLRFSGYLVHGTPATGQASAQFFAVASGVTSLASALLSLGLAWVLFRRKFAEPAAMTLSFYLLVYGIVMAGPMEKAAFYWFENNDYGVFLQSILMGTPMVALLVLFPNGRFVPRWTRWVLIATVPWNLVMIFLLAWRNPAFLEIETSLLIILGLWFFGMILISLYAQFYRYRKVSNQAERQQMKWIIYGFGLWFLLILLTTGPYFYLLELPPNVPTPWWAPASELVWFLGLNILPVSFTIAIMRYRLWNIDLVINRTLVYGALTASVVLLYVLVIGGLGLIFQSTESLLIPLLATGLAAVLFQPFRERLQGGVNRMMYGERDDPNAVLTRLSEQLEQTGSPEAALSGIVTTVAQALKLPYVAIELGDLGEIAASYGLPVEDPQRFALVYQGETVGKLIAGARALGESFTPKDLELLSNVARQAGAAGHAALLTADLRRSRQRLVTAQEEERRRLRRDLHDGLGPTLASLTLKMDATRNVLRRDPDKAEDMLEGLKKQTQETIQEIRTLVYGLRPPALDEFGLVGAIQNFIDGKSPNHPHIILEVSPDLPALPAAYEVAVYRIIMEGITNVLRHAEAASATIRIAYQGHEIMVEVIDDGAGMQEGAASGVGLASMQERAEELGGSLAYLSRARGSHLQARLPLQGEE
jgi:signal transduction histidine kinase